MDLLPTRPEVPVTAPVTTALDTRYSDPKAAAVSWADTLQALEAAELFWISTVRADGRPHVTPLVAVWLDDALHFSTGTEEQKFINLQAHPDVVLTTGCQQWESGLDVVVEGPAVPVTDVAVLRRLAEAWTRKWDGRWQWEAAEGGFDNDGYLVRVFAVRPARVFAHAKGDPFGATTHRF
jgi:nitroimidazol reductase NimA-like FMN-containing flavoprotein (pyridoxamine 5'-phosphate oxidase superfamily)